MNMFGSLITRVCRFKTQFKIFFVSPRFAGAAKNSKREHKNWITEGSEVVLQDLYEMKNNLIMIFWGEGWRFLKRFETEIYYIKKMNTSRQSKHWWKYVDSAPWCMPIFMIKVHSPSVFSAMWRCDTFLLPSKIFTSQNNSDHKLLVWITTRRKGAR